MKRAVTKLALAAAIAVAASAASAQTLNTIKSRGMVNCGANGTLGGFGLPDAQGNWTASMSISAARSRPRSSTTRTR